MKDYIVATETRIAELSILVKGAPILDHPIDMDTLDSDHQSESDTWPYGDLECKRTIQEHKTGVTSLAYHNDILLSGAYNGLIKVFNSDTGRLIRNIPAHDLSVWAMAVHPDSNRFFSASSDGSIKAWALTGDETGVQTVLKDHGGKVYSLAISGNRMLSASSDRTIKVWDLNDLSCTTTLTGHAEGINSIILLNDTTLVSASSDRTIKIWDLPTSTTLQTITDCTSEILDISAPPCTTPSPSGMLFASGYDASIAVYDLKSYARIQTLRGHNWEVWKVHCADGVVFSGSHDHTIKRWDPRTFTDTATLKGHKGYVHAITTGSNFLISGCADKCVKIWR
ncbi:U3 small nucleolar RNA-associated protein 13 [Phlyctochytrium planicorne]|nr:U3 small nucleolar RNA-associated protein 13 [Phlyctochytrium planicorne]